MKKVNLYPITIIADPFAGKYSGSTFLAVHELPKDVNSVLYGNDFALNFVFWDNYDAEIDGIIGKGETPDEAVADLKRKLSKQIKKPLTTTSVDGQNQSICKEMDELTKLMQ